MKSNTIALPSMSLQGLSFDLDAREVVHIPL